MVKAWPELSNVKMWVRVYIEQPGSHLVLKNKKLGMYLVHLS